MLTSYYARLNKLPDDYVPIAISLSVPNGIDIPKYKKLAPAWDVLDRYKRDGDWDAYTKQFNHQLERLNPNEVYNELLSIAGTSKIVLMCYEGLDKNCHRHLVAKWFKDNGYDCFEFYAQD